MSKRLKTTEFSLYDTLSVKFGNKLNPQLQRKATLKVLSHALEDAVIENGLKPVIFTAFQKARYYAQEASRYQVLGQAAQAVVLYGEGVPGTLETLGHDWFVVVNEPRFKALMACREVSDGSSPAKEAHRPFFGIWSYDREVVDYASQVLSERFTLADDKFVHSLEEVLAVAHQPLEQVKIVRSVGDKILTELSRTNHLAIQQITHNQQLLNDLERQEEMFQELNQAIEVVKDERQSLQSELKKLYNELTRSQQLMTEAIFEKARVQQQRSSSLILLQELQAEIAGLKSRSDVTATDYLEKLIDQLQKILGNG